MNNMNSCNPFSAYGPEYHANCTWKAKYIAARHAAAREALASVQCPETRPPYTNVGADRLSTSLDVLSTAIELGDAETIAQARDIGRRLRARFGT